MTTNTFYAEGWEQRFSHSELASGLARLWAGLSSIAADDTHDVTLDALRAELDWLVSQRNLCPLSRQAAARYQMLTRYERALLT